MQKSNHLGIFMQSNNQFVRMKLSIVTLTMQNKKRKLEKGGYELWILEWLAPVGLGPRTSRQEGD